jgi:adenine/guanine phosphoribosyltransferase-like PRPP-binding protein
MFVLSTELFVVERQVVCTKVREGDKRIVRLKEGNPAGCHVVIVDDLVQSGGTLIECQLYFRKP